VVQPRQTLLCRYSYVARFIFRKLVYIPTFLETRKKSAFWPRSDRGMRKWTIGWSDR